MHTVSMSAVTMVLPGIWKLILPINGFTCPVSGWNADAYSVLAHFTSATDTLSFGTPGQQTHSKYTQYYMQYHLCFAMHLQQLNTNNQPASLHSVPTILAVIKCITCYLSSPKKDSKRLSIRTVRLTNTSINKTAH